MTTGVNRLGRCSVISDKYDTKPGRVKTSQPRNTTHDIWRRWDADINAQLSLSAGHHPEVIYRIQHHISISSRSRSTRTLCCNLTMFELVREEILEARSGVFLIWDNPSNAQSVSRLLTLAGAWLSPHILSPPHPPLPPPSPFRFSELQP